MRFGLPVMLAVVLTALLAAPSAARPTGDGPSVRIVQGQQASPGEYPAQGWLRVDEAGGTAYDFYCGGTLVGSRQFLTAAHCAVDAFGDDLPFSGFNVRLGNVDRTPSAPDVPDEYTGVALAVHPNYRSDPPSDPYGNANDVAMLTLDRPASYRPMPVIERGRESLWRPEVAGTLIPSTIIGWGTTSFGGPDSRLLLENAGSVPMRTDAACSDDYQDWQGFNGFNGFNAASMVCAGNGNGDTCQGDSGGPLMVGDGNGGLVLVGVTSFGEGCNDPSFPGVYARIGSDPLNTWVHNRVPRAGFSVSGTPQATRPVQFTATPRHPEGPGYFTTFSWDFDGDGAFDDGDGASPTHTFASAGEVTVGLRASKPGGDQADAFSRVTVGPAPVDAPVDAGPSAGGGTPSADTTTSTATTTSTTEVSTAPSSTQARVDVAPARVAGLRRSAGARVDRRGRFVVLVDFHALAPAGQNAVLTVRRGTAKLGSVRVKVAPGASVRAQVKLTRAGLRRLRKARRLTVTLRLVLGTTVQTRTVTLRPR